MIIEEFVEDGTRVRHYSDNYMKIRQVETGNIYEDAVDYVPCRYTYEETNEPIEEDEISDSEALRIITGVTPNETE